MVLYRGLGIWQHTIRTSSPDAQKYFNQGLALMYGFNRYEALRSFRKVVELDPQAAMGYWGIAIFAGPYINMDGDPTYNMKIACDAVDAGLKLTAVPDKEQAYLRAVATRCPDFKDPQAYVEAMRELARRYPDDLDAGTLFAESIMVPARWKWYGVDGTPGGRHALKPSERWKPFCAGGRSIRARTTTTFTPSNRPPTSRACGAPARSA